MLGSSGTGTTAWELLRAAAAATVGSCSVLNHACEATSPSFCSHTEMVAANSSPYQPHGMTGLPRFPSCISTYVTQSMCRNVQSAGGTCYCLMTTDAKVIPDRNYSITVQPAIFYWWYKISL